MKYQRSTCVDAEGSPSASPILRPALQRSAGFTLVELLVVIGIIALLIGILLPALGRARAQAQQAVCGAQMRNYAQAMISYANENRGWLAGPNTSGLPNGVTGSGATLRWSDTTAPTDATQNMDWVSPTLGKALSLPANRGERMIAIFNTKVRCPSNDRFYNGQYTGDSGSGGDEIVVDPSTVNYSSYSAALGFHVVNSGSSPVVTNARAATIRLPSGYGPKLSKVGNAARKVYIMEGARYVATDTGATFNPFMRQVRGGNFMDFGPATPEADLFRFQNNTLAVLPINRYALRHRDRMNVVFFDGHTEVLGPKELVRLELWWPKGSEVRANFPVGTQDSTARIGMIIP